MAEPPAKRTKRTDSSAMWDRSERPPRPADRDSGRESKAKADRRDDRRNRSRSRDRTNRHREKSRSRDRDGGGGRHRNGDKNRDRERERDRDRAARDRKERSRSKERHRTRRDDPLPPSRSSRPKSRSHSPVTKNPTAVVAAAALESAPNPSTKPAAPPALSSSMDIDPPATKAGKAGKKAGVSQALEDEDPDTVQLRAIMGFAGFRSTKNTKVPGNDIYAVRKEKKTEYRQYMNRVGGFNRPLSPSRQ